MWREIKEDICVASVLLFVQHLKALCIRNHDKQSFEVLFDLFETILGHVLLYGNKDNPFDAQKSVLSFKMSWSGMCASNLEETFRNNWSWSFFLEDPTEREKKVSRPESCFTLRRSFVESLLELKLIQTNVEDVFFIRLGWRSLSNNIS